jgi:hypothetical protein
MSGASRIAALWLALVAVSLAPAPAVAAGPEPGGWQQAKRVGRTAFDLVMLRPPQLVQVVVSAAIFLPAYPVSFLFDGDEDVMDALITEPTDRLFRTPLGEL